MDSSLTQVAQSSQYPTVFEKKKTLIKGNNWIKVTPCIPFISFTPSSSRGPLEKRALWIGAQRLSAVCSSPKFLCS